VGQRRALRACDDRAAMSPKGESGTRNPVSTETLPFSDTVSPMIE
jgi:hypothetical protein